uniref:Uncharacterized protein n=1 Tax=Amazona collaria TaxID=241587 RepID=A0A8B9FSB7_9PSIT
MDPGERSCFQPLFGVGPLLRACSSSGNRCTASSSIASPWICLCLDGSCREQREEQSPAGTWATSTCPFLPPLLPEQLQLPEPPHFRGRNSHIPAPHVPAPHIPAPHIPAPHIPAPHIPAPHIPAPHIPVPQIPAPRIPAPHIPAPHIPAPHIPAPHIPAPHIPAPHIPAPHIPAPHIPSLFRHTQPVSMF